MGFDLQAVAFDVDGTIYPNVAFYVRLLPFLLKHSRTLFAFAKARNFLRAQDKKGNSAANQSENFYKLQAEKMAQILGADTSEIAEMVKASIYRDWEALFQKVKCYKNVKSCLSEIKNAGLKLALLSDFPLGGKVENLGMGGFWDAEICTEEVGHLKPHPAPFQALQKALNVPAGKILFVGNSVRYDIKGAQSLGMRTALIRNKFFSWKNDGGADFVFSNYKNLSDFVLKNIES